MDNSDYLTCLVNIYSSFKPSQNAIFSVKSSQTPPCLSTNFAVLSPHMAPCSNIYCFIIIDMLKWCASTTSL